MKETIKERLSSIETKIDIMLEEYKKYPLPKLNGEILNIDKKIEDHKISHRFWLKLFISSGIITAIGTAVIAYFK